MSKLYHVALAALFTGTVWSLQQRINQNRKQRVGHLHVKPKAVETWEDEGGALPNTGSHMRTVAELPSNLRIGSATEQVQ